jgi:homocysteine S-methyltransferase
MRSAMPDGKFWIKPNAGWPEQMGGRIFYPASADYFGDYALSFWRAGASVIGGCCGTTPAHIAAMRQALESAKPSEMNGFSAVEEAAEEEAGEALKPTLLAQKTGQG